MANELKPYLDQLVREGYDAKIVGGTPESIEVQDPVRSSVHGIQFDTVRLWSPAQVRRFIAQR